MNKLVLIFLFAILISGVSAQDYIFFSDSPVNTNYSDSWGSSSGGSIIALSSGRIPVDPDIKFSGTNALRLRWKSVQGGSWEASVAGEGSPARDVTVMDTLVFRAYSSGTIEAASLPAVCLEDIQGRKTSQVSMSAFVQGISAGAWMKVSIPVKSFRLSTDTADPAVIKAVTFRQGASDGALRTIYLDEIRMFSNLTRDTAAPKAPAGLLAIGSTITIKLTWQQNTETDLAGYRIYREDKGIFKAIGSAGKNALAYTDYTGIPPKTYKYKISAFDLSGNESPLSNEAPGSTETLSDSVLLDFVQRETFKFFWDYAHPVSGLNRDRTGGGDVVTSGGSGFGVMALLVGIERRYITRAQGVVRMLQILNFLALNTDRFHGAFPHWLNGVNGRVIPFSTKDNGGDLVETAFLVQGLLTARQYFNGQNADEDKIRQLITYIWESVEWDWYRKDASGNFLYWHWSPNYNWDMNMPVKGWNEGMIVYLLAVASPTHPVPASLYHKGWAGSPNYKNGKSYFGIPLPLGWDYGGPLFFAHYSFLGFDPRNKKDAYANYFIQNRNHSLIHQAYSKENPKNFPGYDADTWGLTASDDPLVGYMAHEPANDNGTIAPTAALSSMPYTPKESMDALRSFYYEYGLNLLGEYGFKDAFNVQQGWYANSYLAIDQGPIIIMIENYRTGLLWKYFMMNPEIKPMMDAIGFVPDTLTAVEEYKNQTPGGFRLTGNYPNPFNPSTTIEFTLPYEQNIQLDIYDMLGRRVKQLYDGRAASGSHKIKWDGTDSFETPAGSGVYLYLLRSQGRVLSGKMILQK